VNEIKYADDRDKSFRVLEFSGFSNESNVCHNRCKSLMDRKKRKKIGDEQATIKICKSLILGKISRQIGLGNLSHL
jgi:hypothetical protein